MKQVQNKTMYRSELYYTTSETKKQTKQMIEVLYEDNHLLVVNKKAGELVQIDNNTSNSLELDAKEYLRVKYQKPGEAFLGVVHRIDRPVSGVVLFAKTSKALSRLNEELRNRGFKKEYLAVVCNEPPKESDHLKGHISRNQKINKSFVTQSPTKDSKPAELIYHLIARTDNYFMLRVELLTGRHHQIRAQLSSMKCPIKGDLKYGARRSNPDGGISLHSHTLTFTHPVSKERMTVTAPTPKSWSIFGK